MQNESVAELTLKHFKSKKWKQQFLNFINSIDSKKAEVEFEAPIEYTKENEDNVMQPKM